MKTHKILKNGLYLIEEKKGEGVCHDLSIVTYTITVNVAMPWLDGEARPKRIRFNGQYNIKDIEGNEIKERKVYAISATTNLYLSDSSFASEDAKILAAFISQFQKWQEKNDALTRAIDCQEKRLIAFLETELKARRVYGRDTFYELELNKAV